MSDQEQNNHQPVLDSSSSDDAKCANCGAEIQDSFLFCPICGGRAKEEDGDIELPQEDPSSDLIDEPANDCAEACGESGSVLNSEAQDSPPETEVIESGSDVIEVDQPEQQEQPKTKKIPVKLLAIGGGVVALVALIVVLLGTNTICLHDWREATCRHPKVCTKCQTTEGEKLEHDWGAATCTEPSVCSICGGTNGEALDHDVSEWTVDSEATCSNVGQRSGFCSTCADMVTESIEKTSHVAGETKSGRSYVAGQTLFTPQVTSCSVCGEEMDSSTSETKITIGQKNALEKGKSYLSHMSFSYSGLVDQLEFEGYSNAEATFAADYCGADWNEQAAKKAESYLSHMSFSRSGLIDQLEYEGFTRDQAEYGVTAVGY